jgi:hypothetical protein
MFRNRKRLRAAVAVAAGALVVGTLVPAGTAGATGSGRGTPDPGHGIRSRDHARPIHLPWRRPPSGTVGPPVATGLNGPFGIAVDFFGRVYIAETGVGTDPDVQPGRVLRAGRGDTKVLATDAPFVSDVDPGFFGDFAYTVGAPTNQLVIRSWWGRTTRVDLGAFEAAHNPDQGQTYGPRADLEALAGPECWATVPEAVKQVATPYTGIVDSNPFRTIRLHDGSRLVADAAANAILRVRPSGSISVFAVLPPNVVHLPPEALSGPLTETGEGLPQCVLDAIPAEGIDYAFEPVPTGMALGPDGALYVGFLPGGEIPGAAKVVRLDLRTKQVEDFVTGFSNVTDIVFGKHGTLYLTELFDGNVVQVPTRRTWRGLVAGTPSVLASVPLPNGLAVGLWGTVYVSTNSLTPVGEVVPITP